MPTDIPNRPIPPKPTPPASSSGAYDSRQQPTKPKPASGGDYDRGATGLPYTPDARIRYGLQPGEKVQKWDEWYAKNAPLMEAFIGKYPDRKADILKIGWTYRGGTEDDLYDALLQAGITPGADSSGGGGGGRGGGGGGSGGGSKDQQYGQASAAIRNQASTLGLALDDGAIAALSKVVVDQNWSNDQLMDYLTPAAKDTNLAGTVTATTDAIKKAAASQLITVSDSTAREWATRIASDEMSMDGVSSLLKAQAKQRYGWASEQIDQGITVRDMLLPNRDRLANELELPPEQVDLMDPKNLGYVQSIDANGVTRAATDSEVIMRARKDGRWSSTKAAGQTAAAATNMLREMFVG